MEETIGKIHTTTWIVDSTHTAASVGSGGLDVLATPALLAWMERTAFHLAQEDLEQGDTTVGIFVEMNHLAATPVGMKVTVVAEVMEITGRKWSFRIQATDEVEPIATCTHHRFVVKEAPFMEKCTAKKHSI